MEPNTQVRELNLQELEESWLPEIRQAVQNQYGITATERDDLEQEVLLSFLEGRYDLVFDPTKGTRRTFAFSMVRCRLLGMVQRRGVDAMRHSHLAGDDVFLFDAGDSPVVEDPALEALDKEQSEKFWFMVEVARQAVSKLPPRRGHFVGSEYKVRTVLNVFDGIIQGKTPAEISRAMEYSQATVSILMGQIREVPEVKQLMEVWRG